MAKFVKSIAGRAYKFLDNYIHARRYNVRLPLSVSLLDLKKTHASSSCPTMSGYLRDISKTGLSIVVPSLRFGNRCLISGHYPLGVALELPNGVINIRVAPVRYDKLREEQNGRKYLIGARIMQIADPDRKHLVQYMQQVRDDKKMLLSFQSNAKSA